jgi:hypothetical protein
MWSVGALAQGSASIRGHVTDSSGAVLANATVRLVRTDTNVTRVTKTNTEGFYKFVQLPSGDYALSASATGFATAERKDLSLIVNVPASSGLPSPGCDNG